MSACIGPAFRRGDYAGFIRRTTALIIDFVPFVVLYVFAPDLWYELGPADWVTLESYVVIEFGIFLACLVYNFTVRLTPDGTLGYRLMGIRFAYMLGGRPLWYLVLYRAAIALYLLIAFGFDHLWILFDERKQAWHDKVSGFYVVKRGAEPIGTQRVVRRIIHFMMLSFLVWEPTEEGDATSVVAREGQP